MLTCLLQQKKHICCQCNSFMPFTCTHAEHFVFLIHVKIPARLCFTPAKINRNWNMISVLLRHMPLSPWRVFSTSSSSKLVRSQLCFRHICRLFQCSRKHAATRSCTSSLAPKGNHWKTSHTVHWHHIITVSHTQHTTTLPNGKNHSTVLKSFRVLF